MQKVLSLCYHGEKLSWLGSFSLSGLLSRLILKSKEKAGLVFVHFWFMLSDTELVAQRNDNSSRFQVPAI